MNKHWIFLYYAKLNEKTHEVFEVAYLLLLQLKCVLNSYSYMQDTNRLFSLYCIVCRTYFHICLL